MQEVPKKNDGWGAIANYIISKEQDESWRHDPTSSDRTPKRNVKLSFTAWGKDRAAEIGISTFTFWQYRRAGMLYNELSESMDLPPLQEISDQYKAETLNELQKLSRVAPPDLYKELCDRVLSKKNIGRNELKTLWESLRPVLHGLTGRGRTKNSSFNIRVKYDGKGAMSLVLEGILLLEINRYASQLLGGKILKPVVDVRGLDIIDHRHVDAIMIAKRTTPPLFGTWMHGFGLIMLENLEHYRFSTESNYACELFWAVIIVDTADVSATGTDRDKLYAKVIPEQVGVIEALVERAAGKVINLESKRPARLCAPNYKMMAELLKRA